MDFQVIVDCVRENPWEAFFTALLSYLGFSSIGFFFYKVVIKPVIKVVNKPKTKTTLIQKRTSFLSHFNLGVFINFLKPKPSENDGTPETPQGIPIASVEETPSPLEKSQFDACKTLQGSFQTHLGSQGDLVKLYESAYIAYFNKDDLHIIQTYNRLMSFILERLEQIYIKLQVSESDFTAFKGLVENIDSMFDETPDHEEIKRRVSDCEKMLIKITSRIHGTN